MIKYCKFKLTPYIGCALEILSIKLGIDATNLIRQAITEKIERDLDEDDKESVNRLLETMIKG